MFQFTLGSSSTLAAIILRTKRADMSKRISRGRIVFTEENTTILVSSNSQGRRDTSALRRAIDVFRPKQTQARIGDTRRVSLHFFTLRRSITVSFVSYSNANVDNKIESVNNRMLIVLKRHVFLEIYSIKGFDEKRNSSEITFLHEETLREFFPVTIIDYELSLLIISP